MTIRFDGHVAMVTGAARCACAYSLVASVVSPARSAFTRSAPMMLSAPMATPSLR